VRVGIVVEFDNSADALTLTQVAMPSSATVMVDESGRAQCHRPLPAARKQRAAGRARVDSP
jgi:hypothetical protein